jgi:aspartyl-tRNA(Asn)/glutamyl-tRNA(Gln) amidotransferase subunit A
MALSWTLDKLGPLCRSAEDCGLVLQTISGSDGDDPGSSGRSFNYFPQFARKPADLTLGYAPVDFEEWADPAARTALKNALEAIKSLGFKMKEVEIPDFPYGPLVNTIINGEAGSIFEELIRSGRIDQLADKRQIAGFKAMLELPATEYLRAMRIRSDVQEAFRNLFLNVDMLLTPSRLAGAPRIDDRLDGGGPSGPGTPAHTPPAARGLQGMIPAGNLAGLPAISLPCGFADKMPVAISLVARPFWENQLVATGRAFQSQTNWHRQRPPLS